VLLHIPPYSPELNLVETLWKQAKYHRRTSKSWVRDVLHQEVRDALIYSEKSFLPKAKPSKINTLDSRLRGNDDFLAHP
jgi:hypothetical protein